MSWRIVRRYAAGIAQSLVLKQYAPRRRSVALSSVAAKASRYVRRYRRWKRGRKQQAFWLNAHLPATSIAGRESWRARHCSTLFNVIAQAQRASHTSQALACVIFCRAIGGIVAVSASGTAYGSVSSPAQQRMAQRVTHDAAQRSSGALRRRSTSSTVTCWRCAGHRSAYRRN